MANTFAQDYQLSIKAQRHQDDIYNQLFPVTNINRFAREDEVILDIKYHIDVEVELNNGIKLLGQEKALRACFAKFNTFTMEFYQNRYDKEPGEFFNIGAQFYLHSYWNDEYDGFSVWYMVNLFDFLTWLKGRDISVLEKMTRPSTSRANFFYINYNDIPSEFVYASSNMCSDVCLV